MQNPSPLSRRTFLIGLLSTGYALAAEPVADNIVRTVPEVIDKVSGILGRKKDEE